MTDLKEMIYEVTGVYPSDDDGLIAKGERMLSAGYPPDAVADLFELYNMLVTAMGALVAAEVMEVRVTTKTLRDVDNYRFEYDVCPITDARTVKLIYEPKASE